MDNKRFRTYYLGIAMILMFMTAIIVHYTIQVNDLHIALAENSIKQVEQSNKLYDLEQISEENALVVNRYNEQINNINHTLSIHFHTLFLLQVNMVVVSTH